MHNPAGLAGQPGLGSVLAAINVFLAIVVPRCRLRCLTSSRHPPVFGKIILMILAGAVQTSVSSCNPEI